MKEHSNKNAAKSEFTNAPFLYENKQVLVSSFPKGSVIDVDGSVGKKSWLKAPESQNYTNVSLSYAHAARAGKLKYTETWLFNSQQNFLICSQNASM